MKQLVKKVITCDFNELMNQKFPLNEQVGLVVHYHGREYEFLIKVKEGDHLLAIGSAAKDPKYDKKRPLFHRWGWDFKYSTIFYHDPTLYLSDKLSVGWGVGTTDEWYLENIANIVDKLRIIMGVPRHKLMFYGSSAGGFMSLMLSTLLKESSALADVPQINLYKYYPNHWERLKKTCFEHMDDEMIIKTYGFRISFLDLMKKEQYIPNAWLILDCTVEGDYERNYLPFFHQLGSIPYTVYSNRIKMIIKGDNMGHQAISKEDTMSLIDDIYELVEDRKSYLSTIRKGEEMEEKNWEQNYEQEKARHFDRLVLRLMELEAQNEILRKKVETIQRSPERQQTCVQCNELKEKLDEANMKYRYVTEQHAIMKKNLNEANMKYRHMTEQHATLKQMYDRKRSFIQKLTDLVK